MIHGDNSAYAALGTGFFPSVCISGWYLQDYKSKLNEAGMFHDRQLLSGSNPMTWRDAREAGDSSPNVSDVQLRNSARGKAKSV